MANQKQIIADAASRYGVPARLLYGIYGAETNFGKNNNTSSAGAVGPFQFLPSTAKGLGVDPYDFKSAAFGAAKYLAQLRKGVGSWHEAVGHYNSGPAGNLTNPQTAAYIPKVFELSKGYGGMKPSASSPGSGSGYTTTTTPGVDNSGTRRQLLAQYLLNKHQPGALVGLVGSLQGAQDTPTTTTRTKVASYGSQPSQSSSSGRIKVAPGAERAGHYLQSPIKSFLRQLSGSLGSPVTVTTGTNHNRLTVDGNVSDHWAGNASDIGVPVDSAKGDRIAATALQLLGVPRAQALARARQGGLWTITKGGVRYQVIWKTMQGGNHHNHVHIGAAPQ